MIKWPLTSPDFNLCKYPLKGNKRKIGRYHCLITNEKDIFEAALKAREDLLKRKKHVQYASTTKDGCKAVIKNHGFATS